MTAFSARKAGKDPKTSNNKDGVGRGRKSGLTKLFEAAGFIRYGWNKWTYSFDDSPEFVVAPGTIINSEGMPRQGLVARCDDKEVFFPYGTAPADIAARLDDEIAVITGVGPMIDFEDWTDSLTPAESQRMGRVNTRPGVQYGVWV
jgi:hypothetical protein